MTEIRSGEAAAGRDRYRQLPEPVLLTQVVTTQAIAPAGALLWLPNVAALGGCDAADGD